jgi:hypothetical protein
MNSQRRRPIYTLRVHRSSGFHVAMASRPP